jgi:hypothetical protein
MGKIYANPNIFQLIQSSGQIGGSKQSQWWFSSTHSQFLHHMKVSARIEALASVPCGKTIIFASIRRLDEPHGRSEILGKAKCLVIVRLETQTFLHIE